jgi:hypothetical protein
MRSAIGSIRDDPLRYPYDAPSGPRRQGSPNSQHLPLGRGTCPPGRHRGRARADAERGGGAARPSTCVAWVRNRPGTGGLFRSSWDPILLVSRGVPDAIDRAAVRNVVAADYPTKRTHPYAKPVEPFLHVMRRICRKGDLVVDPFAGSGVSRTAAESLGLRWEGCDVDPNYAENDTEDAAE